MPSKRKKKKAEPQKTGRPVFRTVADNRRARFDYDIFDRIEAGIVLTGTEIKSIRAGRANIRDAYAQVRNGEMWLHNMHVAAWTSAGPWGHEPTRERKLLLRKDEIRKFARAAAEKGLTLILLRVYIKDHHAKAEIALAKGRRQYDKRRAIMQRETDREISRAIRQRSY